MMFDFFWKLFVLWQSFISRSKPLNWNGQCEHIEQLKQADKLKNPCSFSPIYSFIALLFRYFQYLDISNSMVYHSIFSYYYCHFEHRVNTRTCTKAYYTHLMLTDAEINWELENSNNNNKPFSGINVWRIATEILRIKFWFCWTHFILRHFVIVIVFAVPAKWECNCAKVRKKHPITYLSSKNLKKKYWWIDFQISSDKREA